MTHAESLKLLFPVEVTGVFDADIALEGAALDDAADNADLILAEIFPDASLSMLADWERVCGLTPAADAPIQTRWDAVVWKLREIGGLSRAYFIALAAYYGWTIAIDELLPFMAGCNAAGDRIYTSGARWVWRVNVTGYGTVSFRAGQSCAGERLTWWNKNDELQTLIDDLKPAHTYVVYNYESRSATCLETEMADVIQTQDGVGIEL